MSVVSGGPITWSTVGPAPTTYDAGLVTYVNGVEIVQSQWEFTLLFSQISGNPQPPVQPGTESRTEPRVQLTKTLVGRFAMSPQHAKAFVEILRQRVQAYEDKFGVLPAYQLLLAPEEQGDEGSEPSPSSDLPAESPSTSPEESSHGD